MYTDYNRYDDLCAPFINSGYITGFDRVIKKGKEATVLHCTAYEDIDTPYLALKIYKDSGYRNFKNDVPYLAGKVWDKRLLKRLKMVKHEVWVETEYRVLTSLHEAGVRVPKPYAQIGDGVLMEYIGTDESDAPLLKDVRMSTTDAKNAFSRILEMLDTMLMVGIVHGDLSAFNILVVDNEPVIIDFPQAVNIASHGDARNLFNRDIRNVCEYFSHYGIDEDADVVAHDLWTSYYRY